MVRVVGGGPEAVFCTFVFAHDIVLAAKSNSLRTDGQAASLSVKRTASCVVCIREDGVTDFDAHHMSVHLDIIQSIAKQKSIGARIQPCMANTGRG